MKSRGHVFKNLNDIRLFAAVVRAGAVTRGAAALGMPAATVSRRLAALEREVGARLVERTARRFKLTEAGAAYHTAAAQVLEAVGAAGAAVAGTAGRPSGLVRLTAPPDFATAYLAQPLARFAERYPEVSFAVDVSSTRVDLAHDGLGDGFDLAVRMGALDASVLRSRRLTTLTRGLYASASWARRGALPTRPAELRRCRVVLLDAVAPVRELTLARVDRPQRKCAVAVDGVFTVNAMPMLRQLVLAGAGIALVPDPLLADDVRAGRAVRVLPGWQGLAVDAHLLFRERALQPRRVTLLLDHLVAHFAAG